MKKFKSFEEEQEVLMSVYNTIKGENSVQENKIQENNSNSELNGIKKGDIVVFYNNNKELNGEVFKIFNEKYYIRGNFDGITKTDMIVSFDQILEHYPKNINFENDEKLNLSDNDKNIFFDNVFNKENKPNDELKNVFKHYKNKVQEDLILPSLDVDYHKDPNFNNKNKNVVLFPNNMKQVDINNSIKEFYKDVKYFIVEKNNELHIVKIKEGFEMKPFVESIIDYMLKNKMIKENISKMQVVGNDSFCILKNSPTNLNIKLKELLKNLLK